MRQGGSEANGVVQLCLVIHHHQPVGNFDSVMEEGHRVAYGPFLSALERHPQVPVALHVSGPLLEWMERAVPGDVDRMAALVERGQLEVVGGGFYEPILPIIPRCDRAGQIVAFADHLQRRLGRRPRGLWLPERVWESSLALDLAEAGVDYTFLDDALFVAAGLERESLGGYYLTEDLGRPLGVFPISERLRYLIPFAEPEEVIAELERARREESPVALTYGDDGEKFGMWPGTHRRVWEEGWLERFFAALEAAGDTVRVVHPGTLFDSVPPTGKIYLPEGSYREMLEWALPPAAHARRKKLAESLKARGEEDALDFVRAGSYRNFRARYPESNRIYTRMLRVSAKVRRLGAGPQAEAARLDLYKGQCNCAYWHGVFGGLYMPHLRAALYHHLIRAEVAADHLLGSQAIALEIRDHDLDGVDEILLTTPRHDVMIRPGEGGTVTEWADRRRSLNLLDVLTRRLEAYHTQVAGAVLESDLEEEGATETIHGRARTREAGLEKYLRYDAGTRASFVDRFVPENLVVADSAAAGFVELGDAWNGAYELCSDPSEVPGRVCLARRAAVRDPVAGEALPVTIEKVLRVHEEARITAAYRIGPAPRGVRFAVEFTLGIPTHLGPRYLEVVASGRRLGFDGGQHLLPDGPVRFVDEDLGIFLTLDAGAAAELATYPLYTVSNSEHGFEKTFQGVGVLVSFDLRADAETEVRIAMELEDR